jgi:hypothetical protein
VLLSRLQLLQQELDAKARAVPRFRPEHLFGVVPPKFKNKRSLLQLARLAVDEAKRFESHGDHLSAIGAHVGAPPAHAEEIFAGQPGSRVAASKADAIETRGGEVQLLMERSLQKVRVRARACVCVHACACTCTCARVYVA